MKTLESLRNNRPNILGKMGLRLLLTLGATLLSVTQAKAGTESGLLSGYGFTVDTSVFEFGNGNVQLNNGSSISGVVGVYSGPQGNEQVQLNNGSSITTLVLPSPFSGNLQLKAGGGSTIGTITSANLA